MRTRHNLRSIFFLYLFLNKLYKVIIKRKLQHSVGTAKFAAPRANLKQHAPL